MVAVDQRIGGNKSDFRIQWFAKLGSNSNPVELLLNDPSSFSVRIDQPTISSSGFFVYQSQVRISDLETAEFDRFWCQIGVSDGIRDSANITSVGRSDETIITHISTYTSPPLPFCLHVQAFFHQTSLKCAGFRNDTIIDANPFKPSSTYNPSSTLLSLSTSCSPIIPPSPISCPTMNIASEESTQTSKLVSVLLPPLLLATVVVGMLVAVLVIIIIIMRRRSVMRNETPSTTESSSHGNALITCEHALSRKQPSST